MLRFRFCRPLILNPDVDTVWSTVSGSWVYMSEIMSVVAPRLKVKDQFPMHSVMAFSAMNQCILMGASTSLLSGSAQTRGAPW